MKKRREAKNASVRLTVEDQQIVEGLQKKLGIDFSAVVKLALRRLAEEEQRRNDFAAD